MPQRVSDEELATLVHEALVFNAVFRPARVTMHDASKSPVAVWFQPEQNEGVTETDWGYYGYHEWGEFVEDHALPMVAGVALDLREAREDLKSATFLLSAVGMDPDNEAVAARVEGIMSNLRSDEADLIYDEPLEAYAGSALSNFQRQTEELLRMAVEVAAWKQVLGLVADNGDE